jgi:putative ABC transport system ATP-binding protein
MIEIRDLKFDYGQGDFRLRVPRLSVGSGSRTALIGPSGSGKTTLLSLVAGILSPAGGTVSTLGVDVAALHDAARRAFRIRRIGLVFQEFELLEHLNVLDNILLPCRISPALKLTAELRDRACRLAEEVGIRDKLRRYVRQLSQGERQRVAICRALLTEPPLLLCDEPTGNLDSSNKQHVLDILASYVDRTEATLLAVTHDREILPRFDAVIDFKPFCSAEQEHA